jgi:hypothetical protein
MFDIVVQFVSFGLFFHPVTYSCLLLSAPESLFWVSSPDILLTLSDCHQHLVTQKMALGALHNFKWQLFPGHRRIAEEFCSFLQVWIVGHVERAAATTGHVWTIWLVENRWDGERARWEGD